MDRFDQNMLATYNGEKGRGLVHTHEWRVKMSRLQEQYNAELQAEADPFNAGELRKLEDLGRESEVPVGNPVSVLIFIVCVLVVVGGFIALGIALAGG